MTKATGRKRWPPPLDRFWSYVVRGDTCWEWLGARTKLNYPVLLVGGRHTYGHRYSWTLHNGPIPPGLCVLHRCDNPPCVRPDHLFLGTKRDNSRDMSAKGRHRVPGLRGADNPAAKLTDDAVRQIRQQLTARVSQYEIARQFGVAQSVINGIHRRRTWTHVEETP